MFHFNLSRAMKILFIGSGCACRLPFVEYLFKKKLQEEQVQDVEVETADMAVWGVTSSGDVAPQSSGPDKVGKLLEEADFIVVMESKQRNFLTRFMDYASWNKIHEFLDYCSAKKGQWTSSLYGYVDYHTQDDEMSDGCKNLIGRIKTFLKEHLNEKAENEMLVPA